MDLTCEQCGTTFDTDRDGAHAHADTYRCPSCGQRHQEADARADGGGDADDAVETVSVDAVDGLTLEVEVRLRFE
jgi:DNA-directed RNA polymerase subunit RPC12/RpoP